MTQETEKVNFHPNWLRIMYVVNIFLTGGLGLALSIDPAKMLSLLGFPAEEPIIAGGFYSIMFAIAIITIAGLRSPLKFSPILFFQILEKLIWLIAVAAPRLIAGTFPSYAWILIAIYVPLTIGNFIAVPWKYMLARSK